MINNFISRILFCCLFLVSCHLCDAQKLHLILVADNRDPEIGNPALVSFTFYERLAQNASKFAGLQLVPHKIMGSDFSKEFILNQIKTLAVGERDVIFFYSSTHGWNDGTSEYPMLVLQSGAESSKENSINLKSIYDQLIQKNARLTIVLGEACNALLSSRPRAGRPRTATHPPIEVNEQYVKDLFLRSKGGILACSSRRGQFSLSDKEEGGRFTQAFFSVFEKYTSNNFRDGDPTWQRIMEDVKTKTNSISRELGSEDQEPYYEIKEPKSVVVVAPKPVPAPKQPNTIPKKPGNNMIGFAPTKPLINSNIQDVGVENSLVETPPKQTSQPAKGACFNNTTFQTIRIYHRFVETYWKGIDNADLDDARETFSNQIYSEDYKELYSNLPQKLGVEHMKGESGELEKLGANILDVLEETNAQLESEQFKLKVSSKLTLVVTDLNRVIKKVENIKRMCLERE